MSTSINNPPLLWKRQRGGIYVASYEADQYHLLYRIRPVKDQDAKFVLSRMYMEVKGDEIKYRKFKPIFDQVPAAKEFAAVDLLETLGNQKVKAA